MPGMPEAQEVGYPSSMEAGATLLAFAGIKAQRQTPPKATKWQLFWHEWGWSCPFPSYRWVFSDWQTPEQTLARIGGLKLRPDGIPLPLPTGGFKTMTAVCSKCGIRLGKPYNRD